MNRHANQPTEADADALAGASLANWAPQPGAHPTAKYMLRVGQRVQVPEPIVRDTPLGQITYPAGTYYVADLMERKSFNQPGRIGISPAAYHCTCHPDHEAGSRKGHCGLCTKPSMLAAGWAIGATLDEVVFA